MWFLSSSFFFPSCYSFEIVCLLLALFITIFVVESTAFNGRLRNTQNKNRHINLQAQFIILKRKLNEMSILAIWYFDCIRSPQWLQLILFLFHFQILAPVSFYLLKHNAPEALLNMISRKWMNLLDDEKNVHELCNCMKWNKKSVHNIAA